MVTISLDPEKFSYNFGRASEAEKILIERLFYNALKAACFVPTFSLNYFLFAYISIFQWASIFVCLSKANCLEIKVKRRSGNKRDFCAFVF